MDAELQPLRRFDLAPCSGCCVEYTYRDDGEWADAEAAIERERILQARIAELEAELLAAADVLDTCRYSEQPAAKRARDAARGTHAPA